jgi:hypothetical protein
MYEILVPPRLKPPAGSDTVVLKQSEKNQLQHTTYK